MSARKSESCVENITYVKNGVAVLAYSTFVYISEVYVVYHRHFSLVNKQYYRSAVEIEGLVSIFWKNKHTQICSELYAAPKKWLEDNGYQLYEKPIKITKPKNGQKNSISKPSTGRITS